MYSMSDCIELGIAVADMRVRNLEDANVALPQ